MTLTLTPIPDNRTDQEIEIQRLRTALQTIADQVPGTIVGYIARQSLNTAANAD